MERMRKNTSLLLQYVIAIILAMATFGAFSDSILSGIGMLLATLLTCPITRNKAIDILDQKYGKKLQIRELKGWVYAVTVFVLVCISTEIASTNTQKEVANTEIEITTEAEK